MYESTGKSFPRISFHIIAKNKLSQLCAYEKLSLLQTISENKMQPAKLLSLHIQILTPYSGADPSKHVPFLLSDFLVQQTFHIKLSQLKFNYSISEFVK
jgi:hypothetical protein